MYQDRWRGKGREHESAGTCIRTSGEVRGREGNMKVQVHVPRQVEREGNMRVQVHVNREDKGKGLWDGIGYFTLVETLYLSLVVLQFTSRDPSTLH